MKSLFNLLSEILNSPGDKQSIDLEKGPEKKYWKVTLDILLAIILHRGLHGKNMLHLICLYYKTTRHKLLLL